MRRLNDWNKAVSPELEEALTLLLERAQTVPEAEDVSVYEAAGRIAARDYTAAFDSPPFPRSPLDGYAFAHAALEQAGGVLPVCMKIYAGDAVTTRLADGCAARIMTGGTVPEGADCVVRQEDTDGGEQRVQIFAAPGAGKNICRAGEDVARGASLVAAGEKLGPPSVALLAAQGFGAVHVYKRLRVGVVSTGSELVCAGNGEELPQGGKIFDSNGPMVCARLAELGMACEAVTERDDEAAIARSITALAQSCDAIITTGGVSVGQRDCIPAVMERLGADVLFHGVAMKPGSPFLAARLHGKPVYALSGNPFAALATLELLALPPLLKASGRREYLPGRVQGTLLEPFTKESAGRRFLRGIYGAGGVTIPQRHASGSIASSRGCNCFVDIPAGSGALARGDRVAVVPFLESGIVAGKSGPCSRAEHEKAVPPPSNGFLLEEGGRAVPVYAVSGLHKTGKTTVLEAALARLKAHGCCVGVVKHDGHGFAPDVPGTDSDRLKKAGADAVLVFSDALLEQVETVAVADAEQMPARLLAHMGRSPDIILLEGFKASAYPKLMLTGGKSREALQQQGEQLAQYLLREVLHRIP